MASICPWEAQIRSIETIASIRLPLLASLIIASRAVANYSLEMGSQVIDQWTRQGKCGKADQISQQSRETRRRILMWLTTVQTPLTQVILSRVKEKRAPLSLNNTLLTQAKSSTIASAMETQTMLQSAKTSIRRSCQSSSTSTTPDTKS